MSINRNMMEESAQGDSPPDVRAIEFQELNSQGTNAQPILSRNIELLKNVRVRLTVTVGTCQLSVRELFALSENSVLTLDKDTRAPVDVMLDGKIVARGNLVAVDDAFGVQITEIAAS